MKNITVLLLLLLQITASLGQKVSILDANLKWNIGTHCVNDGPFNHYNFWATSFVHTEGDTVMNEKHYKRLISCADSLCDEKSLKSYVREEAGKVFLSNKTEELTQFDFNLQQADTMIMDFFLKINIRYYIRIDSVKSMVLQDQNERRAQFVTVIDYHNSHVGSMSINDVFVEGIGSLKFGLEYPIGLFLTGDEGCLPALLCFYSGDNLLYSNPEINNCYLNTDVQQIQQQPELVLVSSNNHGEMEIHLIIDKSGKLFVFDVNGKLILWQTVNQSVTQFCLPLTGVYLYRFESEKGKVQTGKVLVN